MIRKRMEPNQIILNQTFFLDIVMTETNIKTFKTDQHSHWKYTQSSRNVKE